MLRNHAKLMEKCVLEQTESDVACVNWVVVS